MKQKVKNETEKLPAEVIEDRAVKLNPTSELFWKSRKFSARPANWQEIYEKEIKPKE